MKECYIYLTTNLIDGKKYIGQHKGSINDDYLGSGVLLTKAVNKYKKENFKKEILEICDEDKLDEREKYWIKFYNAYEDDNFYNLSEGGQGGDGWKLANKWAKENPEKAKEMYQQNYQKLLEWQKRNSEKVQENIEKMHKGQKEWAKNNKDIVLDHCKKLNEAKEKWQQEHPEEHQKQVDHWRMAGSIANSKKVKCTTTGEVFESVSAAARNYGIAQSNISKVLSGERKSCGKLPDGTKLKWEWA